MKRNMPLLAILSLVASALVVWLALAGPALAQESEFPRQGVVQREASLRTGPGLRFEIVSKAEAGLELTIIDTNATGEWYLLQDDLWISASLVELERRDANGQRCRLAHAYPHARCDPDTAGDAHTHGDARHKRHRLAANHLRQRRTCRRQSHGRRAAKRQSARRPWRRLYHRGQGAHRDGAHHRGRQRRRRLAADRRGTVDRSLSGQPERAGLHQRQHDHEHHNYHNHDHHRHRRAIAADPPTAHPYRISAGRRSRR